MKQSENIFAQYSQGYYDKGISVIPLIGADSENPKRTGKVPLVKGWQVYKDRLPDSEEFKGWQTQPGAYNMGLVCGPQSNICAVDIDTTDDDLIDKIKKALPDSPWVRIGQKGMVFAYRFNPQVKSFKISTKQTGMIVEVLSTSGQFVLPPSIHPVTFKPYVANCSLLDVCDDLQPLPNDIEERLRAVLIDYGLDLNAEKGFNPTVYVSSGSRDVSMIRHAGMLARTVRFGNATLKEAMDQMLDWAATNVQHLSEDELDVNKGLSKIIEFLIKDINKHQCILPLGWDEGLSEQEKSDWGLNFDEENEEWSYEQIIEYLQNTFRDTPEGSLNRHTAIDKVLRKMAKSPSMDGITSERIIKYISQTSGDKLPPSAYKKQIKAFQQGDVAGDNHTEIAEEAVKLINEREGELRFMNGFFYQWQGDHWKTVTSQHIAAIIAREFGHMSAAKKHSDHKGIMKIMEVLLPQRLTDRDVKGVNFANGFLTLEKKLLPHAPEYGMTYVLPYRYVPEASGNFPKFQKLLNSYWKNEPDKEDRIKVVQEAMCTTLFGIATQFQQAFYLKGVGSSGKTQLLEIVRRLVPEDAQTAIPFSDWNEPHTIINFSGKLLNVVGETDKNEKIPGKTSKMVIEGTTVSDRQLFKERVSFAPKAAHWVSSNYLPKSDDTSSGFNRRWLFLEFRRVVPPEERILDFWKQIVSEEIEAITAWAIEALDRLNAQNSYTTPACHLRLLNEMANANSNVRVFVDQCERLVYGQDKFCKRQDLHKAYHTFCISQMELGYKMLPAEKFHQEIISLGAERGTILFNDEENIYEGIAVTS